MSLKWKREVHVPNEGCEDVFHEATLESGDVVQIDDAELRVFIEINGGSYAQVEADEWSQINSKLRELSQ